MQNSIKHFVRKILGIHLLLLALLLAVVTLAAKHVYKSAREQAMHQATERQAQLAAQTAHGVGGFYSSILGDLNLLKPEEAEESDLPDQPQTTHDPRPFVGMAVVRQAAFLTKQLQGRAYLFVVDEQMHPHTLGADEKPAKILNAAAKAMRNSVAPASAVPNVPPSFEQSVIDHFNPWLKEQKDAAISGIELIDQRAIKLVAAPLFTNVRITNATGTRTVPRRTGWLVAAVSAKPIEEEFLAELRRNNVSGAFLVDESMTIMAASEHGLVGTPIDKLQSPELSVMLTGYKTGPSVPTDSVSQPFRVGSQVYEASLLSVCPVKEVLGKRWFVVVASPLKDVDGVVRQLSQKAVLWASFVALSMTAILVSTATQLIMSRMKMERVRHKTLQNEMRQARQIQLAWLPSKTKTTCGASVVDIASLNRPATHISGDFYNFFELPDGRTAVVIGDVTGHGMSAAFLMATTQLLIRNTLPQYCDPGRCMEDVNRQLTNQVFNGQFVTMQILIIDPRTSDVAIATAGHPAPLISDGETFQSLKLEPQLMAGVDSTTRYPTERFRLRLGSSILLYTDGVIETENPAGDRLRLEGLRKKLGGRVDSAEGLLQRAVTVVNTFRRGRELNDDLTMVAVHLLPRPRTMPATPSLPGPAKALPAAQVS